MGKKTVFAIAFILISTSLVLGYEIKDYYPLTQGDSWVYLVTADSSSSTEKVVIQGTEMVDDIEAVKIVSSPDEYELASIDKEGLKHYKEVDGKEYEIFNPPMIIYPNIGIEETKDYVNKSVMYSEENISQENKISGKSKIMLLGIEDVEVPLKKFTNCLKFSCVYEWQQSHGLSGLDECTSWLAPGIGLVKEFCVYIKFPSNEKADISVGTVELISAYIGGEKIGKQ